MAIAIDQTRLRKLVHMFLRDHPLDRGETTTILHIAQLAAGADLEDVREERATLQAIAQHLCARAGLEARSIDPVTPIAHPIARGTLMRAHARELRTRGARELAYALALLVALADLRLTPPETTWLEGLQRALRVDDRRATDIVVCVTNAVATDVPHASSPASAS